MQKLFFVLFGLCFMVGAGCKTTQSGSRYLSLSDPGFFKGGALAGAKQGQCAGVADLDGDGIADLLVGAPYAAFADSSGAVLVYSGTGDGSFSAHPTSLLGGEDNFGFCIANLGDIDQDKQEDFAVGAIHGSGSDVSLCGSITVYKGGAKGQIITKLAGQDPMDKFGFAIAAGDLNQDGFKDIVVGAPFHTEEPAFYQGGAVYVHFGPDYTKKTAFYASRNANGLGRLVTTDDLNGDGSADLLIAANAKLLVFYGSPVFQPDPNHPDLIIKSSTPGFGASIACLGDPDRDGNREIAVGAPNSIIDNQADIGSVYLVRISSGKKIIDLDSGRSDLMAQINGVDAFGRFGSALAVIPNPESEDAFRLAIGAMTADDTDTDVLSGKIYLFGSDALKTAASLENISVLTGDQRDQGFGTVLAATREGKLLIGCPAADQDTGGILVIDPQTGRTVVHRNLKTVTSNPAVCH